MIDKKKIVVSFYGIIIILMLQGYVYANSSWRWISDTRPYDLLPIVATVTILIEVVLVKILGKIDGLKRVILGILLANIVSFIIPYMLSVIPEFADITGIKYPDLSLLDKYPVYTVGFFYLILTLMIEVPIVYNVLKKISSSKKWLLLGIILSNIITTVMTYIAERLICIGTW